MIGTRRKDAPKAIDALVDILGIDSKQLEGLRRKHGDRLLAVLQDRWYTSRDRPRLLHRSSEQGYTAEPGMAMHGSGTRQLSDTLPDQGQDYPAPAMSMAHEPEAVPEEYQERISTQARARFAEVKADDIAKSNTRSRLTRLRQAEISAERQGIDATPHLIAIESQIRALEAELESA